MSSVLVSGTLPKAKNKIPKIPKLAKTLFFILN